MSEDWAALRRARDTLTAQLAGYPEISLIDIGLDPRAQPGESGTIVLRVHIRGAWTQPKAPIPDQIDGIRVVVVPGEYQLE